MNITADTLAAVAVISARYVASSGGTWGGSGHNADNDRTYYVGSDELKAVASISGEINTGTLTTDGAIYATASISARVIPGTVITAAKTLLSAVAEISGEFYDLYYRKHVVGWSKIGDTRILIDLSNEAGYKPLDGSSTGLVYKILSMSEKFPIVYTEAGVFLMIPVSSPHATFGFKQLHFRGLYGPGSVCGDEVIHFFITKDKELWGMDAEYKLKRFNYKEYIKAITPANETIVMHYDTINKRAYISSPIGGYVMTLAGLGGGLANLTAADGEYFASPAAITMPALQICSDTMDMQSRGLKTIKEVQVGTANTEDLQVAIDYRFNAKGAFSTSPWKLCNKEGVVFPIVSGVEFRIRVRNQTFDEIHIDYLVVRFNYSDKRYNRGFFPDNVEGSN